MADLQRLLHNLIRVGSIHAVDLSSTPARVRVLLSAEDETAGGQLVTDWRPYFERRAGTTSTWNPPTVGEQCAVISPGGDLAACLVLVGLHSSRNPAPSASPSHHTTRYPDGAVIQYDHAAHALTATLPGGGSATLVAPGMREPPSRRRYRPVAPPTACEPSTRRRETSKAVISRMRLGMAVSVGHHVGQKNLHCD